MKKILLSLCVQFFAFSSEIPNFNDLSQCNGVVLLLTTPRSGSNLISSGLSAMTRRPISWLKWGDSVFGPFSARKEHPSYNRLKLPLVSDIPLLYRTHYELDELQRIPATCNQLIFLTRNPKELIFRAYRLAHPGGESPDFAFIDSFLRKYLAPFKVYDAWDSNNKILIYYEDLIANENKILLDVLRFMGVSPTYLEDFISNKEEYKKRALDSYQKQHQGNNGGVSSVGCPKPIFYSQHARPEILSLIDEYIIKTEPNLWELYLKRFASYQNMYD